ncbi:MAG: FAD-binding oxidoreductase [Verrucomicrobia bacterium]|nr:FAD-binding oxidoreductase [Verrucomicrobiota bacterium]MBS0636855.1 FAD-binding oxidoreductase [Verrucomicrobiota bacterium]
MDIAQHYEQEISFNSPWLQFERTHFQKHQGNSSCDVAIVGGGISGIMTLYYLLTETDKNVLLFEQGRIASQASGNNAALACIHIERPIQELVEEFGIEKTRQSFLEVDQSWDLMLDILDRVGARSLLKPLPNISLAMSSKEVLLGHTGREKYNREFGRTKWHYYVDEKIDVAFDGVEIHRIPKEELLEKLHIVDDEFIAVAVPQEQLNLARLNSAEFCFAVIDFLSKHYSERFTIYEESPIARIKPHLLNEAIQADDIILCTNGYKGFEIFSETGARFDKLHNALTPREGYMAAFKDTREPYAQAFFDDRGRYKDSPYFYLSHIEQFTVLGGPEFDQPDGIHTQEKIAERALTSQEIYREFLKNSYNKTDCPFSHFWMGIMGYTSNGLRWVGQEPEIPGLWYNLGCNGIGITTSIGAAKRLVALIQGQKLPASLFDPT